MRTLSLVRFISLTALLLTLRALPAFAEVEAAASGNIIDNQITSAAIDPPSNSAAVRGTLTCSAPTQVQVYASVRQSHGNSERGAEYFGSTWIMCDSTPAQYEVTVTPGYESARLIPGHTWLNTWATYCGTGGCFGYGDSTEMQLRPDR